MPKNLPIKPVFGLSMAQFRYNSLKAIRSFFDQEQFIEIETPYLLAQNTPDPFIDPFNVISSNGPQRFQLHTSPELWLKKAQTLSLPLIFSIARVFRDDPKDHTHLQEFTMIEWYREAANLQSLIKDVQAIFAIVHNQARILMPDQDLEEPPFVSLSVAQACERYAQIDLPQILARIKNGQTDALQIALIAKGDLLPNNADFHDSFAHLMAKYIEPNLPIAEATILYDWPMQSAALAKASTDSLFCQRFEIYFRGLEIANAYQECVDANELRYRFVKENLLRDHLGKPTFPLDEEFLESLRYQPESAGIALGIDRLFMAVLGKSDLSQVVFGHQET